jgi:endothelin-converting enzyme/putative endopeptidase
LLKGAKYDSIRSAYRNYIVDLSKLAGLSDPEGRADRIIALETRLAKDQWTPEQLRDPVKTHNPMTRAQLMKLAPQFDWTETLRSIGLGSAKRVDVSTPSSVAAAGKRIADVPLGMWKEYLTFRFISGHASYLPKAFDDARFGFYSHTLNDVPEQRARWKRGIGMLDDSLGEAVGQLYVAKYWPDQTAKLAQELVDDMHAAYAQKISNASWMDDATRKAALAKLASFDPRIGHPVKWIDYSSLDIRPDDPLANAVATEQFGWDLQLKRFPHPVDRTLWYMTPQTVNAYYDPTMNQITVPAAILQPPFFDAHADPAVNYAETGATTIGHEMGHGFDDEGRQFDAKGRLRDWWTPATAAKYKVKADRLAAQFDQYEPIPGVHIKGKLTLGENLADLGGLETAYAAYRRYVVRHGEPPVIDGFTGDQRFFLAYAQAWQGKAREGALRDQLLSNPHSPEKYRVNGIVRNFDPWYKAFNVQPGDKMYLPPEQRVHVW